MYKIIFFLISIFTLILTYPLWNSDQIITIGGLGYLIKFNIYIFFIIILLLILLIYLMKSLLYWPIKKIKEYSLERYREKPQNAFIFHISGRYDESNYLLNNDKNQSLNLCMAANHLKLKNYIECEKKLLNYSKNSHFYKESLLLYMELAYKRNNTELAINLAKKLINFKDKLTYTTTTYYLYLLKEWEIVLPMLKYCIKKKCNNILKRHYDIAICAILYEDQASNKKHKLIKEINSLDDGIISLLINIKDINIKNIDYLYKNNILKKNNLYINYLFFKIHAIEDNSLFINILKCLYNNDKLNGLLAIEKSTENDNLIIFLSHLFNIDDHKKRLELWEDYIFNKFNWICAKCKVTHSFWLPVCKQCEEIDSYIFNSGNL